MTELSGIHLEFFLLIITTVLMILLLLFLIRIKVKSQMHYVFISLLSLLIIWNLGAGLAKWCHIKGYTSTVFVYISYIGNCFVPISVLLMGIIFAKTRLKFTYRHLLLYFIPVISMVLLITNQYHHLFYINYSFISSEVVFGKYFIVHVTYSYLCILFGMYYLLYFSIKNTGFFSKQSFIILIGIIIPLVVNILFTLKIVKLNQLSTPISFSFAVICFYIAIFKYDFLGVMPIAMQTVVDKISNSFVVIDLELRIVDFNRAMVNTLKGIVEFKRKEKILKTLEGLQSIHPTIFQNYIEQVHKTGKSIAFEHHFIETGYFAPLYPTSFVQEINLDEYYTIEITPIIHNSTPLGTIILLTNISQHKEDVRIIKEQEQQITEQVRLASLGTLMGGISHNLKTPIMSISGCIAALEDLTNEYRDSIGNPAVNDSDYHEIADEMFTNLSDLKSHVSYISHALTAIKNQVINPDSRGKDSFTPEEAIINIEFLMKYEIKSNFCTLDICNEVRKDYLINGDIGTLVQIINNLISNSIQAYEKITDVNEADVSRRRIELIISEMENYIIFKVIDYGRGIPQQVQEKLFKEMTTTKGKEGSGIGLYTSYSKVKVMFNGDMWFKSQEGVGTTFHVIIQHSSS